jgi:hypothetical protein
MAEDEDRDERNGDHRRKHERCKPFYGDVHERIEIIKKLHGDDAREFLRTIIEAAFYQGVACGCMECHCEEEEREERRDRTNQSPGR